MNGTGSFGGEMNGTGTFGGEMNGTGSFGAGRAGAAFDPVSFAKRPQTVLRLLAWVRGTGPRQAGTAAGLLH